MPEKELIFMKGNQNLWHLRSNEKVRVQPSSMFAFSSVAESLS
jgi:hypothetical protein